MAEDHLSLLCLVDGDTISRAFSVITSSGSTVDQLRDHIKAKMTLAFSDVDASELALWLSCSSMDLTTTHTSLYSDHQQHNMRPACYHSCFTQAPESDKRIAALIEENENLRSGVISAIPKRNRVDDAEESPSKRRRSFWA
ncbi:hypothetical protein EDD21DRAFT_418138 [Dissophora ornata]|nr:hypothetical protein BGZ58_009279 [Dissophora ornata]KAI8598038.1 hypothetical protein EDD21DRAFT_418138 [Dissophora ornata]